MLLGIDIGTTILKAAVFDPQSGKLVAHASRKLAVDVDSSGKREQVPGDILRALETTLSKIRREIGSDWNRISGIGLATQGGSTFISDRDSGEALTPMALWNDTRAFSHYHTIAASKPARYWRSFSLRDEPGMGLARIEWLKERTPDLLNEKNLYAGIGEYVFHHLTGVWRQDACNALQIGCYDARKGTLTDKPLRDRDVPLSFFAPLRKGHETQPLSDRAARKLGLAEGIPVAGPYNDHEAGFMSAMRTSKKPLQCSLGTAWVGNFVLPEDSTGKSPFHLPVPAPASDGRLVIMPLLTGNVTWDWALQIFVDADHRKALQLQQGIFAECLLPPEGLIALPWLNRPNPLAPDVNGGACLVGLGPSTSKADMLRAVAAGMCHELARVFDEVRKRGEVDGVVLSGGASKGEQFRQLIAALFAPLPVRRIVDEDWMGTRGCLYAFSKKVVRAKTERVKVSRNANVEAVRAGHELYLRAFDRLCSDVLAGQAYRFSGRK
jgi:xylulokinase